MVSIAVMLALGLAACGQAKPSLKEWQPGTPLTWEDFTAPPPEIPLHDAETNTGITASRWTCERGRMVVVGARAYFNRATSFVLADRTSAELLTHEQGHFDLTELYARQLRERLRAIRCADRAPEAIQATVDAAVQDVNLGFLTETERYDRETDHGRDQAGQQDWNRRLRERLDQTAGL
jgi:hypothetical protein